MKYLSFIVGISLLLTPAVMAADNSVRQRAKAAYDELDDEPSSSAPRSKKVENRDQSSYKNTANSEQKSSYPARNEVKAAPKQPVQQEPQKITALPDDFPMPVIMVLPSVSAKGTASLQVVSNNPYAKAAMDGVNEYLTKNHYEVKSLEGNDALENVIQVQNSLAGTDEDLSYLASLVLNADVYIKFSGSVDQKGFVTVELNAYESSTARLLGTQSATVNGQGRNSKADQQANLRIAAKKAMPGLEAKIISYWQDDVRLGNKYKVIMNIKGDYNDTQLEDLQDNVTQSLKSKFDKTKVNVMTSKTIDMVVYSPTSNDVNDVYSMIRNTIKPFAPAKKINISKKLIIMDIQ